MRHLVVFDHEVNKYLHMSTVWTDEQVEDVPAYKKEGGKAGYNRWDINGEYDTKEDAMLQVSNLNRVLDLNDE